MQCAFADDDDYTPSIEERLHHPHPATVATPSSSTSEVTALNRGWSDIDKSKWFAFTAGTTATWGALMHPMYFAATRRYTMEGSATSPSSFRIIANQLSGSGVRGIYRGFFALTFGTASSEWVYNGILEYSKEVMPLEHVISRDFFAGALADFTSQVFYCPFGLIASRQMTAGHGVSKSSAVMSFPEHIRSIYRRDGIRGYWVGLGPSLMLFPSTGLWWGIFGEAKRQLYDRHAMLMWLYGPTVSAALPSAFTSDADNIVLNSIAGAFAGASITLLINPVWVLRARVQVAEDAACRSLRYVIRDVWRTQGIAGFYRGTCVNASVYAMESAIYGTLYDLLKYMAQVKEPV
eukprot:PhM_4_TR10944/c0_g3_i1/m.88522/K15121/SLC25A44; solute carrier family 25, member 44